MIFLTLRFFFIGSWKKKIANIKQHKFLLLILLIYPLLHVVSLLWSNNLAEGLSDINKKIALFVFPLTLCAISPLNKETLKYCFIVYLLAIFSGTIWGEYNFFTHNYVDIRTLIGGISHIRFALNAVFSIIVVAYLLYSNRKKWCKKTKIIFCAYIIWVLLYMLLAQLMTGIVVLGVFLLFFIPYYCIKHFPLLSSKIILVIYFGFFATMFLWIGHEYNLYFTPNKIYSQKPIQKTPDGNQYTQFDAGIIENGNYLYYYWNQDEIKQAWKQRTGEEIGGKFDVLLRYLNSISPYKDAKRVRELSQDDIANIKNNIENKIYTQSFSLKPRLYKIFWQIGSYRADKHMRNFSELQRVELWYNALQVIKRNFFIGCGCGDVHNDFSNVLCQRKSQLCGMNLKAHNQYLYTFATFGVIGFLLFLFYLIYPPLRQKMFKSFIYCVFFFIVCVSMLSEDTLDSVQGIVFFILLNSVMLLSNDQIMAIEGKRKEKID